MDVWYARVSTRIRTRNSHLLMQARCGTYMRAANKHPAIADMTIQTVLIACHVLKGHWMLDLQNKCLAHLGIVFYVWHIFLLWCHVKYWIATWVKMNWIDLLMPGMTPCCTTLTIILNSQWQHQWVHRHVSTNTQRKWKCTLNALDVHLPTLCEYLFTY